MTEEQYRLLHDYVSSAEPSINRRLRNGESPTEVEIFDSIFSVGVIPRRLFRLMPNECMPANVDFYYDLAYLSTSVSIDNFIERIQSPNLACLEIITTENLRCIDVNALLPEHNNEEEYILPRGLRLRLQSSYSYQTEQEFTNFLDRIHCDTLSTRLLQNCYSTIKLYTLTLN